LCPRTIRAVLRYETGGHEEPLGLSLDTKQNAVNLKIQPTGLGWLLLNNRPAGYYVAAYRGELLNTLLQAGAQKLSAAERMSISYSISASVRSADIPLGKALSLQPGLLRDPERRVVTMAAGFMDQRERVPAELKTNYQRFIRKSVEPLVKDVSWQASRPESDDERLQRLALLSLAANAGEDSRLIADAKRLALAWLENRQAVPPDEANTVVGIAGRYADPSLFDKLMTEAKKAKETSDREHLVSVLASCTESSLAQRALDALAAHEFEPVDSMLLLFGLASHIETRSFTYDYLKQHYDAVVGALPGDSMFQYLPMIAAGFDTPDRQSDMEAFFKDKDVKLTGGPRIIAQASESIQLKHAYKKAQLPSLIEFLKTQ
jgi:alanyl aminopeptidase